MCFGSTLIYLQRTSYHPVPAPQKIQSAPALHTQSSAGSRTRPTHLGTHNLHR